MARSGRFGRMPAQAPDLTSSLVSMMNQFRAQEDQNFFDAWTNGGEVNGRPVNDQRLLQHIKSRRDDLDRDDPMWDEWDNRLWQYRFKIAESKAELRFANTLTAIARMDTRTRAGQRAAAAATSAANARMRGFYVEWAGKVPRRSAAYRDLMASAAQYARAAAIAQQRTKKPLEEKDEPSEYEKYISRVKAIDRQYIRPLAVVKNVLDAYAQSRGFISSGGSILDLPPDQANVIFDAISAGLENDPAWPYIRDELRRAVPGEMWHGRLTYNLIERLVDRSISGGRQKIQAARAYPDGDLSSHIAKYRGDMVEDRQYKTLDMRLSGGDIVMDGYADWQEDLLDARDPSQATASAERFEADLWKAYNKYMAAGDEVNAGRIRVSIDALRGNVGTGTGAEAAGGPPAWGGGRSLQDVAQIQRQAYVDDQLLKSGRGYIVPHGSANYAETPATEVTNYDKKYEVRDIYADPIDPFSHAFVLSLGDDGTVIKVAAPLTPIYMTPGSEQPTWYRADWDNQRLYGMPTVTANGIEWSWTRADAFESTGMVLKPAGGRVGLVPIQQDPAFFARQEGIFGQQAPGFVLTPEEQAAEDEVRSEQEATNQARDVERAELLRQVGLGVGSDGTVVQTAYGMGATPMTPESMDAAVGAIDQQLDQRYGPRDEAAQNVRDVTAVLPGSAGPEALAAQTAIVHTTEGVAFGSSMVASISDDFEKWAPKRVEVLTALGVEPGLVGLQYAEAAQQFELGLERADMPVAETIAAIEGTDSPRLVAGAAAGRATAAGLDWREWDTYAERTGGTPEERQAIRDAGRGAYEMGSKAVSTAMGAITDFFGNVEVPGSLTTLPGAPVAPLPVKPEPNVKTADFGLTSGTPTTQVSVGGIPAVKRSTGTKMPANLRESVSGLKTTVSIGKSGSRSPGSLSAMKTPAVPTTSLGSNAGQDLLMRQFSYEQESQATARSTGAPVPIYSNGIIVGYEPR